MNTKTCQCCGKRVKRYPVAGGKGHGKRTYPHKCPHGKWCSAGHRLIGQHANWHHACADCRKAMKARDDARRASS